jgi:hypothetical protein
LCKDDFEKWEPKEERIATAPAEPRNDREMVNHPQHYNHGKYECIDVMVENFGKEAVQHFCLLNAFKYAWRSNYKNGIEDVKKAMWYLDKYVELEGENCE